MSNAHEPTVEDLNVELTRLNLEMETKMKALQEKLQVVQERAEEEKARKAEEEWLKAEAEKKAEEEQLKAEAEEKAEEARQAEETKRAEEACLKAEAEWKAQEACEAAEKRKAERVHLENRKRLDRELIKYKEQMEVEERKKAEEREKVKAGNVMMLETPADLLALERARLVNAKNTRLQDESHKPRAGSSKAPSMPTPTLKPKAPVNLASPVREEEWLKKTGKRGKSGDVAVSTLSVLFGVSDIYFSRRLCVIIAQPARNCVSSGLG
jgi:HD-GYP domain-containing protein (c-di-GMP phosphodiesterase class II)